MPTSRSFRLLLGLATSAVLVLAAPAGCGNGRHREFVAPTIKATFSKSDPNPPPTGGVVYFDNVRAVGDVLNMDVMVQDAAGTLDVDDIDLVLRYDAAFMQVTDIRPETILGDCGAVNPACLLTSPICLNNQAAANSGGERFCRSNGSTPCLQNTDCTAPEDACGDFGRLEASFAVITGPKTCSNSTSVPCASNSECQFCKSNSSLTCSTPTAECSGFCSGALVCSGGSFDGKPCTGNADCVDTCNFGVCSGCPSVTISAPKRIVNLTVRVITTGTSELRFVISSNPLETASFLRKEKVDLSGVLFWPNVEAENPGVTQPPLGQTSFIVMGTK